MYMLSVKVTRGKADVRETQKIHIYFRDKNSMLEIKNTLLGIHIGLDIVEKTTHEFEDAIKAIQKETMKILKR